MASLAPPPSPSAANSPTPSPRPSSTAGTSSSGGAPTGERVEKKKRSRGLLRDYYGLPAAAGGPVEAKGDPLDLDSKSFDPKLYFEDLSGKASLPALLKRENELLIEIRELDGERQSLVYNHHHELIEASDTIRKMKSRALALDASLDSLKSSFQSISQLSTSLSDSTSQPSTPSISLSAPSSTSRSTTLSAPSLSARATQLPTLSELPPPPPTDPTPIFDPLTHLPPILSLPPLLRSLLATNDRKSADQLWGLWEPPLRAWEDAGVPGMEEVGKDCRSALRGRRASVGREE